MTGTPLAVPAAMVRPSTPPRHVVTPQKSASTTLHTGELDPILQKIIDDMGPKRVQVVRRAPELEPAPQPAPAAPGVMSRKWLGGAVLVAGVGLLAAAGLSGAGGGAIPAAAPSAAPGGFDLVD